MNKVVFNIYLSYHFYAFNSVFYLSLKHHWLLNCLFLLIVKSFYYNGTFPWVCEKCFCGPYSNYTHIVDTSSGLWNIVVRVSVGFKFFLTSIDCFYWNKSYFKFIYEYFIDFFYCWVLFLNIPYQNCSIVKRLLRWVQTFSVGYIKIRNMDLIPPQYCGSLWWGWQLYVW